MCIIRSYCKIIQPYDLWSTRPCMHIVTAMHNSSRLSLIIQWADSVLKRLPTVLGTNELREDIVLIQFVCFVLVDVHQTHRRCSVALRTSIADCRNDFSRRKAENDLSAVAMLAGSTTSSVHSRFQCQLMRSSKHSVSNALQAVHSTLYIHLCSPMNGRKNAI